MKLRSLALLALWPVLAAGQVTIGPQGPVRPAPPPGEPPQPAPDEPEVVKLAVTPAPEPVPPLAYRFDVPRAELRPGNSVPFYYRALVQLAQGNSLDRQRRFGELYDALQGVPLSEFPVEKAREALSPYGNIFKELERATVREETDWDWRLEELGGTEAITFLLPEIQDARELARLLHLKARLEIAEGRFDDAEKTLRTGFALARAVAEPPTLINDLVGVAIASIMGAAVRDWIDAPGSPNVYWAVAALPDPFIDLRPALEYELAFPVRFAPWLAEAKTDDAPPELWRDRFATLLGELGSVMGPAGLTDGTLPQQAIPTYLTFVALRSYPAAKAALIARGYDARRVEAMPVGQVLAIQQKYVDELIAGESLKALLVPAAEADEVGEQAERLLRQRGLFDRPTPQAGEPIPLMSLLAPATRQAVRAGVRSAARHAGLRTIEAIRMHAATGSLPESLDAIDVVPVPRNPVTGEPFPYRLEGETAVLDVVADPLSPRANWRVEITLEK